MVNPISEKVRGGLYIAGISIGILSVIAGPLMIALETPEAWVSVVVSAIGAVTTLLSTLARSNLTTDDGPETAGERAAVAFVDYDEDLDDPIGALTD